MKFVSLLSFALGFSHSIYAGECKTALEKLPIQPSEMNYRLIGKPTEKLPFVMVHGLDSAGATFIPQVVDPLSQERQILLVDQRGHGETVDRGEYYFTDLLAEDLIGLIDHLGFDQIDLLGHSNGGRTAIRFASMFPNRVRRIVIEDMEMHSRDKYNEEEALQESRSIRKLMPADRMFAERADALKAFTNLYGDDARAIEYIDGLLNRRGTTLPDGRYKLFFRPWITPLYGRMATSEDLLPILRTLTHPILFLRPENYDAAAMSEKGEKLVLEAKPDAKIIAIPGAAHNMHGSQTEAFNKLVREFLNKENLPKNPDASPSNKTKERIWTKLRELFKL